MAYGITDRCTGGTVTACHYHPSYPETNAFDNNTETQWNTVDQCTVPNQWIKYDFGVGVSWNIGQLKIYIKVGEGPKDFTVQGSNNDSDYTVIYTGQTTDGTGWQTFSFVNTTPYRYIKINQTTSWHPSGYNGIMEIEMYEYLSTGFFSFF
jgi:hypothetical protein